MSNRDPTNAHDARVLRNIFRADMTPNTPDAAEAWLKNLGVRLVEAWIYHPRAGWKPTAQVKDEETFLDCIDDTMRRKGARYALWHDGEMWCLLSKRTGDTRRLPNREAAEMLAIHGA